MTSNIINLNKARKARDLKDARRRAEENIVRFGRTKVEKAQDAAEKTSIGRELDGAQLDVTDGSKTDPENLL